MIISKWVNVGKNKKQNRDNMKTHKDLDIWKEGMSLVEKIYLITAKFPKEEIYGLRSQMRRCAVSIPSNIAEGAARNSVKEYIQFLYVSLGSLSELETQVEIALRLGYLNNDNNLQSLIEKQRRKQLNFIKYLKMSNNTKKKK